MKEQRINTAISSNKTKLLAGVCDIDYYHGRQKKCQLIYRLRRRTEEVKRALTSYSVGPLKTIIDVGTADGLMLSSLRHKLGPLTFIGVDYSLDLLRAFPFTDAYKVQADAMNLPFGTSLADAVIATAVIEHVPDPARMVRECAKILRPGGLFILTTPDPMIEKIATTVGLFKNSGHQTTLKLKEVCSLCEKNGFAILEARKFMFSPVGFPAEKTIERILARLGLSVIMANQLVVAQLK